ncbi:Odorant receptor 13a [Anthophora retusa]
MSDLKSEDVSIRITSVFMKIIGLWMAANRSEQRVRNITVTYSLIAILIGLWIQTTDLYHSWGDFGACLYNTCNILSLIMPLFKILVLLAHKNDFFNLILYLQRKFLHADYNDCERTILLRCKRQCTLFICFFTIFTQATILFYFINPVIANIGRNASDRLLPFNMWVNLPLTETPYYEMTYVLQTLSLYHIGVGYFCFDNFLCIMNLHVATQFRILQHRMENIAHLVEKGKQEGNIKVNVSSPYFATECYTVLKNYIRQHQKLIAYCTKLEEVFNTIILIQLLIFSLLMCLDGYQILMANTPIRTRLIFTCHFMACMCQLLMFTYSCDCIIRESSNTAEAVYSGPWTLLSMTASGRMLRKDLTLIILRSSVPCYLTAKGFFAVSLETYTKVLSTAASYFTLLKQNSETADI